MIKGTARFRTIEGFNAFLRLIEVGTKRQKFRYQRDVTMKDGEVVAIQVWWEPIMDIPSHLFSGPCCTCFLCSEGF